MALVAVITDTHAGCRSESRVFFDAAKKFYDGVFFPTIDAHGIKTVLHLGDLVDRRKYIAFVTANRLRRDFMEPLLDRGCELIVTPGNHDLPYRNLVSVNAEREILPMHPKVRVVDRPQVWNLHERPVLLLPWICDENRSESMALIRNCSARVVMGHLELAGFEMYRGVVQEKGMSASLFDGYRLVLSGHYHQPSVRAPVRYLGAPFEMVWSDYDCPRGFHLLDTNTLELRFVTNPHTVFTKLFYDDSDPSLVDSDPLAGQDDRRVVKVVVQSKNDPLLFDRYVEAVEARAASVQVVDDHRHADGVSDEDIAAPMTDTLQLLLRCAEETDVRCDRAELSVLLSELYHRAQEIET